MKMHNTTDKQSELAIRLYELTLSHINNEIEKPPLIKADMLENKLHYTSEFALRSEKSLQKEIEYFEKILGDTNEGL